jgi:hypothetical protein
MRWAAFDTVSGVAGEMGSWYWESRTIKWVARHMYLDVDGFNVLDELNLISNSAGQEKTILGSGWCSDMPSSGAPHCQSSRRGSYRDLMELH